MNTRGLRVGLTGGIGTGKSLALGEFSRLGAKTLCLDRIAREVVAKGSPGWRRVVRAFGAGIQDERGEIDRSRLGELVFKDARRRARLERLVHPLILKEMRRRMAEFKSGLAVVDAPLLFEAGLEREFDVTMMVTAERRARIARVAQRDGLKPVQVRRRLGAQMAQARKKRLADVVVSNDGSRTDFRRKVGEYYRAFNLMQSGRAEVGAAQPPD